MVIAAAPVVAVPFRGKGGAAWLPRELAPAFGVKRLESVLVHVLAEILQGSVLRSFLGSLLGCLRNLRAFVSHASAAFLAVLHFLTNSLLPRAAKDVVSIDYGALRQLSTIVLVLLFVVIRLGVRKNQNAKAQGQSEGPS
jgi:hypothetical protein